MQIRPVSQFHKHHQGQVSVSFHPSPGMEAELVYNDKTVTSMARLSSPSANLFS